MFKYFCPTSALCEVFQFYVSATNHKPNFLLTAVLVSLEMIQGFPYWITGQLMNKCTDYGAQSPTSAGKGELRTRNCGRRQLLFAF